MSDIFAPVQSAKAVNSDGTLTSQLLLYLNQIQQRIGGVRGGTYTGLTVTSNVFIWDLNAAPVANVVLGNGVNTLTAPINQVPGAPPYRLTIIQPPSGAAGTISWPKPPFVFPGGIQPTLSSANNAIDEFWFSSDGTNMKLCVAAINFS